MISRRVFLKNGGLALVSLGFAPSFLARTAEAAGGARRKVLIAVFQRGAVDGLNMVVPFGERAYYSARPTHRDRAARTRRFGASISTASSACTRAWRRCAALGIASAGDRPRLRIARHHAIALRRAGLHGERHARREEHRGRLAESLSAGRGRAREHDETPFRAVALTSQMPRTLQGAAPALAMQRIEQFGLRGGGAAQPRPARRSRSSTPRRPIACSTAPARTRSTRCAC